MGTGAEVAAILGVLASAAGTGVSIAGAKAAGDKMNQAVLQQIATQQGYQRQATPLVQQSIEESSPSGAQRDLAQGQQAAESLYRQLQSLPLSSAQSPLPTDTQTQERTRAALEQQNAARSGLQGYSNLAFQQWLRNQAVNNQLGLISNLSRGEAGLLPFQLQSAQQQSQNMAGIGSLLGTAGSLAGVYGSLYPYLNPPKPVTTDKPYVWQ